MIHVASPLPGRDETKALIDVSTLSLFFCTYHDTYSTPAERVDGTLNVIRRAADAGIKHISLTGSIGAFVELAEPVIKAPVTDKDWNPYAEEQAFTSPMSNDTSDCQHCPAMAAIISHAVAHATDEDLRHNGNYVELKKELERQAILTAEYRWVQLSISGFFGS